MYNGVLALVLQIGTRICQKLCRVTFAVPAALCNSVRIGFFTGKSCEFIAQKNIKINSQNPQMIFSSIKNRIISISYDSGQLQKKLLSPDSLHFIAVFLAVFKKAKHIKLNNKRTI